MLHHHLLSFSPLDVKRFHPVQAKTVHRGRKVCLQELQFPVGIRSVGHDTSFFLLLLFLARLLSEALIVALASFYKFDKMVHCSSM